MSLNLARVGLRLGRETARIGVEHRFGASGHVVLVEQLHQASAGGGEVVEATRTERWFRSVEMAADVVSAPRGGLSRSGKWRYTVRSETPAAAAMSRVVTSSARRSPSKRVKASRMNSRVWATWRSRSVEVYRLLGGTVRCFAHRRLLRTILADDRHGDKVMA